MEKVQKTWSVIRNELNEKLLSFDQDYRDLSKAAGISYYAARRFKINGAKNQTGTAIKLCVFFGISQEKTAKLQSFSLNELIARLTDAWDGSESHAELLVNLIESTKSFKIQTRDQ